MYLGTRNVGYGYRMGPVSWKVVTEKDLQVIVDKNLDMSSLSNSVAQRANVILEFFYFFFKQ